MVAESYRTTSGLLVVDQRSGGGLVPNDNDPALNPPATVGPPTARPGDPDGIEIIVGGEPVGAWSSRRPPRAMPWSGWPAEWCTPNWGGQLQLLTDTAWTCLDDNASILAAMPPYLVGAAESLPADWINNPDPDRYTSWVEFAKQLVWDFQGAGEVFVLTTARYANTYPARFHVVPPWFVEIDWWGGQRRYHIGSLDVTADMLHIRYTSRTTDLHGRGPLEVGGPRMVAAAALARYAQTFATSGAVPNAVLTYPGRLSKERVEELQAQWVEARMSRMGLPAVLSGGIDFRTLDYNPKDLALVELSQWNEARIAVLLKVPPICVALPSGGDSMTYSNVESLFDYRWRAGLSTIAANLMAALSGWALPRGTTVEVNRDEFVKAPPLERAQTWAIYHGIGAVTTEEIRQGERFGVAAPSESLTSGVLQ